MDNKLYMGAVAGTNKSLQRLFKAPQINAQMKEDGQAFLVNYRMGKPYNALSRQGTDTGKYFPEFMSNLNHLHVTPGGFNGTVHHELMVKGVSRPEGNGLINKAIKDGIKTGTIHKDVDNCLHSVVLDYCDEYDEDIVQAIRYDNLLYFINTSTKRVAQWPVKTIEEAKRLAKKIIRNGGEGIVCKDPTKAFKGGKPWFNVKLKNEFSIDLQVVDWKPHSKKEGWIGSLYCTTSDTTAKLGVWVTARTDEDKQRPFKDWIGHIFKVKCESVTAPKKGLPSLQLPRFDGANYNEYLRTDKSEADTYQQVLDQELMSKDLI